MPYTILLIAYGGAAQYIAYALPVLLVAAGDVCIPLIAEEITEYPLPESIAFLAALKVFLKNFAFLGESFFDFLYLYK